MERMAAVLVLVAAAGVAPAQEPARATIYTPDGQMRSDLVEMYVEGDVTAEMGPCLRLLRPGEELEPAPADLAACHEAPGHFRPIEVVRDVPWTEEVQGKTVARRGTLLLFSLRSGVGIPVWVVGDAVRPVLYWNSAGADSVSSKTFRKAIGPEFYLANRVGVVLWSGGYVVVALIALHVLARRRVDPHGKRRDLLDYVESSDGQLSLPLVQMALWTLAVGGVVLGFALIQRRVPDIPATLVALMGFSAATALVGHWQVKKDQDFEVQRERKVGARDVAEAGFWDTLVCIRNADGQLVPSLAKGQMIFWTVLAIGLFLYKSLREGVLWDVSDQLVLLMGISQASFLGREQLEMARKDPDRA